MYAYIDESGNTGYRILDPEQPLFVTAALITKTNFDIVAKHQVAAIARKAGVAALHGSELGANGVESIAAEILRVIKKADARFYISRLEKRYLAAAKVFDTYFDAGENKAVPYHIYWFKILRLTMVFKLATYVLTEEMAQVTWECVTATSVEKSRERFLEGAKLILARTSELPDERSQEIVRGAMQWALANPHSFSTHLGNKLDRHTHTPNVVAFVNLMDGIECLSISWDRPVKEIVHDNQPQFERTLAEWHKLYSRPELAGMEPLSWPGETERHSLSRAAGSRFRLSTDEESSGLQVVDVILWLFKRSITDKGIGPNSQALLNRVFLRGLQNDMSFSGVGAQIDAKWTEMARSPIDDEAMLRGSDLLAEAEAQRQNALRSGLD